MIRDVWNRFWFATETPRALGVFRIVFGLFLLLILGVSFPNWQHFYGPLGMLPSAFLSEPFMGYSWSLFALSDTVAWAWALYAAGLVGALCFTAGFYTRTSGIALFFLFASMLHRNPYLINGQDQVAVMLLFLLCFAPAGRAYSIDAVARRFRNLKRFSAVRTEAAVSRWALQLMRVAIALIYLFSAPAKVLDSTWRDGSAVYYVTLSPRWFRFSDIPFFHDMILSVVATVATLAVEIAFPLLIWFRRTKPYALAGIVLLHASLLVVMGPSVFFFHLAMLVSFTLFLEPTWIARVGRFLFRKRATVLYDGDCSFCVTTVCILRAIDGAAHRLSFENLRETLAYKKFPSVSPAEARQVVHVVRRDGSIQKGFFGFREIATVLPVLVPLAPFLFIPGVSAIGVAVYRFVASRRFGRHICPTCYTNP